MTDIRNQLLSKADFKTKTVDVDGVEVTVREMSLKERKKLMKAASDKDGNLDGTLFLIHSIILCAKDSKGKPVFEPTDVEVLEDMPANSGVVGILSKAITDLIGGEEADLKNE